MSLVTLSSQQYRGGAEAQASPDPAYFTTHFSEPLTLFPGQTVELVSFSYSKGDLIRDIQIESPEMLISVPELNTRSYNATRANVGNAVAYVPAGQMQDTRKGGDETSQMVFQPLGYVSNKAGGEGLPDHSGNLGIPNVSNASPSSNNAVSAAIATSNTLGGATRVRITAALSTAASSSALIPTIKIGQKGEQAHSFASVPKQGSIIITKKATDSIEVICADSDKGNVRAEAVSFASSNVITPLDVSFPEVPSISFTPPVPYPLSVNVPEKMNVNQLTCRISLIDGRSASQFGGSVRSGEIQLNSVTILAGGENYTSATTVSAVGSAPTGGEKPEFAVEIEGGVIKSITLTKKGKGYETPPVIEIADTAAPTGGSGAAATFLETDDFTYLYKSVPFLQAATVCLKLSAPPTELSA